MRVDVESLWCMVVWRLNLLMVMLLEFLLKKGVVKKLYGVVDIYFEDLMMRESGVW